MLGHAETTREGDTSRLTEEQAQAMYDALGVGHMELRRINVANEGDDVVAMTLEAVLTEEQISAFADVLTRIADGEL